MKIVKVTLLVFSAMCFQHMASAYFNTNFYKPYDVNFRMAEWKRTKFRLGANFEYGTTSKSRNWDENKAGALRLYNDSESSLGMLMGAQRGSDIHNLANALLPAFAPATDDGVRGRFKLDGKYEQADLTFCAKYNLPIEVIAGHWDVSLYVPFRYRKIENVKWNDQTKTVLNADRDVRRLLTNNIHQTVADLGNLNLKDWDKTGLSDIVVMLGWFQDFKQLKDHLKNVRINLRVGLSAPSGDEKDEDTVFSLPMGNDGAWGVPLGAGIDLDFVHRIKAGLDFDILVLLDSTRIRRLKTDVNQTDFLLLHKGKATRSHGIAWKFNLFLQAQRFFRGFSAMVAYQFLKHDEDHLTADTNDFSYHIINSAKSLQEWGMQNFVFQLNYDFFKEAKNSWLKPQLSFFYKLPITGKRIINPHIFGAQIAFNF